MSTDYRPDEHQATVAGIIAAWLAAGGLFLVLVFA
jgi:hypothetical protein